MCVYRLLVKYSILRIQSNRAGLAVSKINRTFVAWFERLHKSVSTKAGTLQNCFLWVSKLISMAVANELLNGKLPGSHWFQQNLLWIWVFHQNRGSGLMVLRPTFISYSHFFFSLTAKQMFGGVWKQIVIGNLSSVHSMLYASEMSKSIV